MKMRKPVSLTLIHGEMLLKIINQFVNTLRVISGWKNSQCGFITEKKKCQAFLISFLSRVRGDRNRFVFGTAFAGVVESCVGFLQVNRLKSNPGEIIVRQVKDSKYCVQGTVIVCLADGEAA